MPTIYVLKCQNNKYYIGKTDRKINNRINEHFSNDGSEWTRKYKPLKVIETIENADMFDEDKYTKKYMSKYGINNVRGGSYTTVYLPDQVKQLIEKELCSSEDKCYRCMRKGHFISDCYAKTYADGTIIEENDDEDEYKYYCENCYKEFDTEYDVIKHEKYCNKKLLGNKKLFVCHKEIIKHEKYCNNNCYRCGHQGHYSNDCYASFHIDGHRLKN